MKSNQENLPSGCCGSEIPGGGKNCCQIQSVVPIDNRGQIVLPKEVREKAKIQAGDKLAVISYESNGEICCISLIKIDQFAGAVKEMLGPFLKEMLNE